MLDRTYADAIENVVGIVEAMAERAFRAMVPTAEQVLKGKGKVFQRLDDFANLFHAEGGIDLRGELGGAWTEMTTIWAARHVFTHCDGIVDAKYLQAVPASGLYVGQRLRVTDQLARTAIRDAEALCRVVAVT